MQLISCIVVLEALASAAIAVSRSNGFIFPDTVGEVEKRQATGERYECHSNCGYALQGAGEDADYCEDAEWIELFQGCLDCALEFDIWRHYGGGLTPAAEACGLDANPRPVGVDDAATTSDEPTPTSSALETDSEAPIETSTDITAAPGATTVGTALISSAWTSVVSISEVPTSTANGTTPTNSMATTPPTTIATAMGAHNLVPHILVAGGAIVFAVSLM